MALLFLFQKDIELLQSIYFYMLKKDTHNDLKDTFPSADYVGNGRYVFNISGNNFRIVAVVLFIGGILELRFVGTHAEYDKIKNCSEI